MSGGEDGRLGSVWGGGGKGRLALSPERRAVRAHTEPPAPCWGHLACVLWLWRWGYPQTLALVPARVPRPWGLVPPPTPGTALHLLAPPGVFLRPLPLSSCLSVTRPPPTCLEPLAVVALTGHCHLPGPFVPSEKPAVGCWWARVLGPGGQSAGWR